MFIYIYKFLKVPYYYILLYFYTGQIDTIILPLLNI